MTYETTTKASKKKWSSVRCTKASVGQTFLGQNVEKGPLRDIWDPNQIHGDFMGDMVIPLGFTAMNASPSQIRGMSEVNAFGPNQFSNF